MVLWSILDGGGGGLRLLGQPGRDVGQAAEDVVTILTFQVLIISGKSVFVTSIQSKHLQKNTRAHGFHQNSGTRRDVKKIISVRGEAHVTNKLFNLAEM